MKRTDVKFSEHERPGRKISIRSFVTVVYFAFEIWEAQILSLKQRSLNAMSVEKDIDAYVVNRKLEVLLSAE